MWIASMNVLPFAAFLKDNRFYHSAMPVYGDVCSDLKWPRWHDFIQLKLSLKTYRYPEVLNTDKLKEMWEKHTEYPTR